MFNYWRYFVSNGRGGQDCTRLGLHGHDVPLYPSLIKRHGLAQRTGLELWDLLPDGPAHRAGLREDDIVIAVDNRPTPTMTALERALRSCHRGASLGVVILRDDSVLERSLVLES